VIHASILPVEERAGIPALIIHIIAARPAPIDGRLNVGCIRFNASAERYENLLRAVIHP
jgi:hypothetical protein